MFNKFINVFWSKNLMSLILSGSFKINVFGLN